MQLLTSTLIYENPWLTVREDTVRRGDGSEGLFAVVDAADIALVVPLEDDRIRLVEQYRHPVARRTWELPSGSVADGLDADAATTAARELREETGLTCGSLTLLGTLDITPSTMSQRCRVSLASGSITDAKTVAAYTLLLLQDRT